jgi:hypothetical protein
MNHDEVVKRKKAGIYDLDEAEAIGIMFRVLSEEMGMEGRHLSSFTRRNLKKVSTAKMARCLRSVLSELEHPKSTSTLRYYVRH